MNKIFIISLSIFILSLGFVMAQGLDYPHHFYGSAVYNGAPANGLTIDAYINGAKIQSTTTENGYYIFLVKDNEGKNAGKTINFYLNGINTGMTAIFENGASTKLDLSASGSIDAPSDNNKGGGSGGSAKRTTSKSSSFAISTSSSASEDNGEQTGEGETNNLNKKDSEQGFFSRITGAVIGPLGPAGTLGVLIFLVALLGISAFVAFKRKQAKAG